MVANWDFHFNWTKDHLSWEDLDPLRHEHDELGAAAYDRLIAIRDAQAATGAVESQLPLEHGKKPDLLALLRDNHTKDPILGQFWEEVNCVPDWVDWEQIERGQRVFYRYIGGNIFSFYGLSISNGAIPGIVEVLMRTGGSSTKSMLFRTFETFSYVLQVTRGLGAVQPGGDGHAATVRVRLLHAAVRCRMRTLIATRPEYFDETALGVPLNDLVSMYTVLGFAGSAPWLYLSCQGVFPKAQEIEDHVALHRYLGYVMGAPIERFCATTAKTKAATESCFYHMVRTSPRSGAFVNNFIECLLEIPSAHVSRSFLEAAARWTNGHKLCDALDLGRPGPYYYALCAGHSMLCSALVYLQRAIPSLDEFIIEVRHLPLCLLLFFRHTSRGHADAANSTHERASRSSSRRARSSRARPRSTSSGCRSTTT